MTKNRALLSELKMALKLTNALVNGTTNYCPTHYSKDEFTGFSTCWAGHDFGSSKGMRKWKWFGYNHTTVPLNDNITISFDEDECDFDPELFKNLHFCGTPDYT